MKRRTFLEIANLSSVGLLLFPSLSCTSEITDETKRIPLKVENPGKSELPEGKRVPFGWPAAGINPGESIQLKLEEKLPENDCWLRISIAQEIREEKLLHVRIPDTETYLGAIDIRFSSVLVPYELEIKKEHTSKINKHGLELTLEAPTQLWIFDTKAEKANNQAFLPHLLTADRTTGAIEDFLDCFLSVSSVQAFGWREGTVLDGLWQIHDKKGNELALEAIQQHFDLFFDDQQNLVYEDGHSRPKLNQIDGIESTIPFATLARLDSDHPILKEVVAGWQRLEKENGAVIDGHSYTAEGCYTVAYPMAVLGKAWNNLELMENALAQLKHRFVLFNDGILYLRYHGNGNYTYPNWARGAAWTLLGFARTMAELKDVRQDEELISKFREGIELAISMQGEDGLWHCFMHRPEVLPDTGGSAGIAAAILVGIENGFLAESYKMHALQCWEGLQAYISPDGFLRGVAQDNRAGEKLQESDYRVIAQMGMGLMAHLYAHL